MLSAIHHEGLYEYPTHLPGPKTRAPALLFRRAHPAAQTMQMQMPMPRPTPHPQTTAPASTRCSIQNNKSP